MGQVVYKMDFFLHQASLSMTWLGDIFLAAIAVLSGLPRPASRDPIHRRKPPFELVFKRRCGLSHHAAPSGCGVAVHLDGSKANGGQYKWWCSGEQ